VVRGGGKWSTRREGEVVRGFEQGGSKLTRKRHDSGRPVLKNHQLGPPPLKVECRGGSIWIMHRRSERANLCCPDLQGPYHNALRHKT
jgi:hypothetical protein